MADNTEAKDKEEKPSCPDLETSCNPAPPRPSLHPILSSAKSNAIRRDQQKATRICKVEDLSGPVITDQLNISLETKQEPEYVSIANIFLTSEHSGGMFFFSPLCFGVFSPRCGWWNVLDSSADGWQGSGTAEWHGNKHVPWPCGWPGSGGCLATRRPRAGRYESQKMMDWLMWGPVGKPWYYFDLALAREVSTLL